MSASYAKISTYLQQYSFTGSWYFSFILSFSFFPFLKLQFEHGKQSRLNERFEDQLPKTTVLNEHISTFMPFFMVHKLMMTAHMCVLRNRVFDKYGLEITRHEMCFTIVWLIFQSAFFIESFSQDFILYNAWNDARWGCYIVCIHFTQPIGNSVLVLFSLLLFLLLVFFFLMHLENIIVETSSIQFRHCIINFQTKTAFK